MNAIILFGSPRAKGHTARLCERLRRELGVRGVEVGQIDLSRRAISGCIACDRCREVINAPGCAIQDHMQGIYPLILEADILLFAAPVYMWGLSAQLKAAQDRLYCMDKPGQASMLSNKRLGLIMTSGGDAHDGADLCIDSIKRFAAYNRMHYSGTLLVPEADFKKIDSEETKIAVGGFADSLMGFIK